MPNTMSHDELAGILSGSPFHRLLGLELVPTDSETLELAMPFNEEIERAPGTGQFHGGIISSLIDIAGDFALIKAFALEHGPAYAHPRRVVFKDSLPLGGTHKIDRRSLELEAAELMVAEGRASVG
jgi:acyl-coenzyme A thioesterase PaaI-like protein